MNDIERAIEEISKMQFEHRDYRSAIFKKDGIPLMYTESVDLAISALEKQIPKKPVIFFNEEILYCPSCTENVNKDDWYCSQCGQKIDWEVGNE